MEGLTRLVAESLARHGFDRPLDYRRLHWSRWFRCESHHSLLLVPSKPGVFAMAEEIVEVDVEEGLGETAAFGSPVPEEALVGTAVHGCPAPGNVPANLEERRFTAASGIPDKKAALAAPALALAGGTASKRRMLAVTQFFEDDDMAFTLDRMLTRNHPMQSLLTSGRYFVRFVIIEDASQRRSVYNALNQWMANSSEKASGIGSHFAGSLELTPATEYVPASAQGALFETSRVARPSWPANAGAAKHSAEQARSGKTTSSSITAPQLDSGAAANLHCPLPFPSGF
jgi:hypothetical protein